MPQSEDLGILMAAKSTKRDWFDRGAVAFALVCPGVYANPTYPCPICLTPFTIEAPIARGDGARLLIPSKKVSAAPRTSTVV